MNQTLGTILLYAGFICLLGGWLGIVALYPTFFLGMIHGFIGGPIMFFWSWFGHAGRHPSTVGEFARQTGKAMVILLTVATVIVVFFASR